MPVAHENIAVQCDGHSGGSIECVGAIACYARFAQGHQHFSIRTEFENLLALSVASLGIGNPDIPAFVHKDSMGNYNHSRAEALHKVSGSIKFEDRRIALAQAGIPAASLGHPHIAVAVDTQLGSLSPGSPFGHLGPPGDRHIGIGQGIGVVLRVGPGSGYGTYGKRDSEPSGAQSISLHSPSSGQTGSST